MSQSIEKLQKRLAKDPASLIFFQLAEEHRKEGNLQEAENVLKQGLTRHPNYWSARVTLARIYQQVGNSEPAQKELEKVVRAVPDHLLANRLLAEMYLSKNADAEALKCLRVVHMLNPADHEITEHMARIEAELAPEIPQEEPHIFEQSAQITGSEEGEQEKEHEQEQEEEKEEYPPTVQMQIPEFIEKTDPMRPMPVPSGEVLTGEPPTLKFDSAVEQPVLPEVNAAEVASPFHVQEESEPEPELEGDDEDLVVESAEAMSEDEIPLVHGSTADELSSIANLLMTREESSDHPHFQELEPEMAEESLEEETVRDPSQDRTQPIEEEEDQEGDELTTETLAELYLNQGLVDKAVKVYQKLLLSDPGNMQILQRLRELNSDVGSAGELQRKTSSEVWIAEAELSAEAPSSEEGNASRGERERLRKIHALENWLTTIQRRRH